MESFIDILRCGVYGIFTEDIEHVQHNITFLTPLNYEYEDLVFVKNWMGLLKLFSGKFQDTRFTMKLHLEVS